MPKENEEDQSAAPWDSDLEEAFEDEDIRKQVGEFLGEKVQPYVTKLEQDGKPNRDAIKLWDELGERPVETTIQVVNEIYGKDVADKFADLLQGGATPEEAAEQVENEEEPAEETDTSKIEFDDLPPEVQNAVAAQEQEKQREAYYSEIDRVKEENAEKLPKGDEDAPDLNVDLFHPFVVSSNGDFDVAMEGYLEFIDQAKEKFGIQVPGTEDVNDPPPAINSETKDASSKPAVKEEFGSLDEAIDSFFEDQKSPPPTVGTA